MNDAWLKPALLGIDRPQAIPMEGPVGEVLAALASQEDAALGYSQQVGVLAACQRAAMLLAAPVAAPAPAAPDAAALPADHRWSSLLKTLFSGGQPSPWTRRVRHEACLQLVARGRHLPVATLPLALEAGARLTALRPHLRGVLGERGRWLAACNSDWAYAVDAAAEGNDPAELERAWQEGSADVRLQAFQQLRSQDAGQARARLQESLKTLSARERVDLITALQPQLSDADAELLQPLLKDRSREVRQLVGPMLAQLPGTPHAQYLHAQMQALLQQQRSSLLGRKAWVLAAPDVAQPGWADAGLDPKRPNSDPLGERAWWLYQLVRQLPLAWWEQTLAQTPAQVLVWARGTDWYDALLRAWLERVDAHTPQWVEALIGVDKLRPRLGELMALLPLDQRERHWPANARELHEHRLLTDVLGSTAPGQTLSEPYSLRLAASIGAQLGDEVLRYDYYLRDVLLELLAILHPAALAKVSVAEAAANATDAMLDCVQQANQLLALRQTLHSPL